MRSKLDRKYGSIWIERKKIRPKAGTYVACAIPGNGTLRKALGAVGDFGYSVSIITIGTYIQTKAGKDLPVSVEKPAEC